MSEPQPPQNPGEFESTAASPEDLRNLYDIVQAKLLSFERLRYYEGEHEVYDLSTQTSGAADSTIANAVEVTVQIFSREEDSTDDSGLATHEYVSLFRDANDHMVVRYRAPYVSEWSWQQVLRFRDEQPPVLDITDQIQAQRTSLDPAATQRAVDSLPDDNEPVVSPVQTVLPKRVYQGLAELLV